jgi:hypothetical protein
VEVFPDALEESFERLPDPEGLEIEPEPVRAKCASYDLGLRDAVRQLMTGGSGWGDPLLRPVEDVLRDIEAGSITGAAATAAFGVVLANGTGADLEATAALRQERRRERLGRKPLPIQDPTPRAAVQPSDGKLACSFCDTELGDIAGANDGPARAERRRYPLADRLTAWNVPVQSGKRERFELVEQCCPGCGTLLEVDVVSQSS